jgi:DnaK suppressor protein
MSGNELNQYRRMLEAKQRELVASLLNRDDITIEKTPDALDEIQFAGERELALLNLDRGSTLLQNVRNALARIDDGSFGTCLRCEEEIKPKRLAAVPWTSYCINCQQTVDLHQFDKPDGYPAKRAVAA